MGKGQLGYATHILPDESCLFVETPKVACSTIKTTLQHIAAPDTGVGLGERGFEEVHQRRRSPMKSFNGLGDIDGFLKQPGLFTFCFVRDPYTRTLSAWRDKICRGQSRQRRDVLNNLGEDPQSAREIPFEEFIEFVQTQLPKQMNPHWRVQADQTLQGLIDYDFIGRFEQFDADFARVLDRIGQQTEIRTNRPHATGSQTVEMSDRAQRMIAQIYARDFETFGYAVR